MTIFLEFNIIISAYISSYLCVLEKDENKIKDNLLYQIKRLSGKDDIKNVRFDEIKKMIENYLFLRNLLN